MPITRPTNYAIPFASAGVKNTIPDAPSGSGKASFTEGFPPVTMLPLTAGGIPPEGKDFNGIYYDITSHTVWVNAGGQYQFDAALSTAIGGYPIGMVLQNNAGTASYVSAVNNNTTDFNTTPSSIGTLWMPYSGATAPTSVTVNTTGGSTVLNATQYAADFIVVTGVLTSNASIIFPAAFGEWEVINNTTGPYTVTCYASGGTGVPVKRGYAESIISNGTDVQYAIASGVTQTLGDSSKALATTEFVTQFGTTIPVGAIYVNSNITLDRGFYLVDSSAGPLTLTMPTPTTTKPAICLIDAKATWAANNVTLNLGANTLTHMGVVYAGPLTLNVADQMFTIWWDGSTWRLN